MSDVRFARGFTGRNLRLKPCIAYRCHNFTATLMCERHLWGNDIAFPRWHRLSRERR